jgi:hypothetical protein
MHNTGEGSLTKPCFIDPATDAESVYFIQSYNASSPNHLHEIAAKLIRANTWGTLVFSKLLFSTYEKLVASAKHYV